MRITSKVILGFGLMIVIIIAVHLYQTSLMQEMLDRQRQLTEVGFGTGMRAHRVLVNLADLEEFSLKYLASGDPLYLENALPLRERVDSDLHEMLRINLFAGPLEEKTRKAVSDWNQCSTVLATLQDSAPGEEKGEQLETSCASVFDALEELIQASDEYLVDAASRTRETGQRVTSVSRIALPVALVLSAGVSLVVFRSIWASLKDMMQGAQRISQGDFDVKLRQDRGDELSELAIVLNRMTRRLGELDRLKREFVSHISHDLRAPLASVEETTRLLLDEFSEGLDSTQKRLLELSLSSSRRLSRLIGNLLDLSRIEAGVIGYDFREVDLRETVSECVGNLEGLFLDKHLEVQMLEGAQQCTVVADRIRLARVIENLLSNAAEFSPRNGEIEVGIDRVRRPSGRGADMVTAEDGEFCLIWVSDQGPGVPPSDRDRIFDQFYTAGRPDSDIKKGGTGLGLTIARRIVEDHNGQIWVEENPTGRGSRFCILLAHTAQPEPEVPASVSQTQA